MRLRFLALLLCSPLLANCAGEVLETSSTSMLASTSDAQRAARLISQYRATQGLGPVTVDARLNQAAEYQARCRPDRYPVSRRVHEPHGGARHQRLPCREPRGGVGLRR